MENSKYIFLNIDGVLVTNEQYFQKEDKEWSCKKFDKKCVKVLNQILYMTDAEIIISSDWKGHYDLPTLRKIFKHFGVNCEIIDVTGNLWKVKYFSLDELEQCRSEEILQYVKEKNIKNWVAIDDLPMQELLPEENFVHCPRPNEGIKQSNIREKILKKLT